MRGSSVGRLFSAAVQGLELGIEFGVRSLEALLWIAETVEESVYRSGSLAVREGGVRFSLDNPPLRHGAFSAVRLYWEGAAVGPSEVRIRAGADRPWRTAASVTRDAPLELHSGEPIDFEVGVSGARPGATPLVRLELECRAIPPLVWVEFRDRVGEG